MALPLSNFLASVQGAMDKDPIVFLKQEDAVRMKEQATPFDAKTVCWIATTLKESAGYVAADIEGTSGDMVTINVKGEKREVKKEECEQMNPPKYEKCTDMSNLTFLNEASVLYNIQSRYAAGMIYTYSGLFCVVINPYKYLPIYKDECVAMYRGKRRPEMPPHVFAIVDNAYQDMLIDHDNQSMLITGESGAGKTENTKKVIQYIAKVAGVEKDPNAPVQENALAGTLDEQIVSANPLLEAFGNAKTTRNNNSSRFGKFIRCHFSQTGKLAGADIESYLLEKNRVTHQGSQERNYHIFYQILYATTDEQLANLALTSRDAHNYLYLSYGVTHVDRMDDNEEYALTVESVKVLGFTQEENDTMWKIAAAILNFSNCKFTQKKDEQAQFVDLADAEKVAFLLGLQIKEFSQSLIKPKVKVGTEYVNKGQNVTQVMYAITALSKSVFERLFWWIVERINKAFETKQRRSYYIGVLDIAGFEIFEYNSFDQLCINYTNERLQQFFNHHMFVLEQEEYKKEGIAWESIDFGMDLANTIDLIEKPGGILAMLEEECIVPKATDQTYLSKMHKSHAGKAKSYGKPTPKQTKQGGGDFILHHYAGSVGYSVAGWLEKNKDPINEHTAQLFSKAALPLLGHLFADYDPDKAGKRKGSAFQTVSFRHKEQLKGLMSTLMSTSPHFVRCIIPNENKAPGEIDGQLVLHQLRCNGVLEGIRICRKGFPSRMMFADFKQRYQILAASAIPPGFIDGKVACEKLVEALQLDENEFRIGLTKVFFRAGIIGELEEMRDERLSKIIAQFQAYCKAHLMRIEYKKMKDRVVGLAVVQRNIRKFFAIRNWPWWKLYILVQPMLSVARAEDEMAEKEEALKAAMENAEANAKKLLDLEESQTNLVNEKEKLFADMKATSEALTETEDKLAVETNERMKLETQLNEIMEKLEGEEHAAKTALERGAKQKKEIDDLSAKIDEGRELASKLEGEKASRDRQIDALNEDIAKQDEAISKANKEKKGVEENLAERDEQLAATEDKLSKLNKEKNKVDGVLKETEFNFQKEKDSKAKVEKEKRKIDGDLKETRDKLGQTEEDLAAAKDGINKRDKSIRELEEVREGHEGTIKQLQKKIADLLARIEELEEELENERKAKLKSELAGKDLQGQLEELNESLLVSGDATTAQTEISKKKDGEISRLRKEMEEANAAGEEALSGAKSKAAAALAESQDEVEAVKKAKAKSDKDKAAVAAELADAQAEIEKLKKQNAAGVKTARSQDDTINDLKGKLEELEASLVESEAKVAKASADGGAVGKALEEVEAKLSAADKAKKALDAALTESKEETEAESKAKHDLNLKLKAAVADNEALNEQLEEEIASKGALNTKLTKALADAAAGKGGLSVEDSARVDELESAKSKLAARVQELEEALAAGEAKAQSAEKVKNRLNEEVEDLQLELEKVQMSAQSSDKKQRKVEATIREWAMKCEELKGEVESSQKNARTSAAEVVKARAVAAELDESLDAAKKENRALAAEVKSISENLSGGGKSSVEVEKLQRKLGAENEELSASLEEAETTLEQKEAALLKLQLEHAAIKQVTDRKAAEKDEELETSRKNHQRQILALQATIDSEVKTKNDLIKDKKALESQIIDLENHMEANARSTGDAQKTARKLQSTVKELTAAVADETAGRDVARAAALKADAKANEMSIACDEARVALEQSERARKLAEGLTNENSDRLNELQALYAAAASAKRKVDDDYHALQDEIEELENNAIVAEEKSGRALAEVDRLKSDLAASQTATTNAEKSRSLLAKQLADANLALQEAEGGGGRGIKAQIRQLELKIMELESDLDTEARKSADVLKQARKADKRAKEVEGQLEEERRKSQTSSGAVDHLKSKVQTLRFSLDESEANLNALQTKYKKSVLEAEEAEKRCESAEIALQKARQRAKTTSPSIAVSRQRSRARTPAATD